MQPPGACGNYCQSKHEQPHRPRPHEPGLFWLKDDALEDSANLPASEVIAEDITSDLEAAMEQFATIAEDLKK